MFRAYAGRMGDYAPINGLNMYYETHGHGEPLVLLHGNLSTIEVDFGPVIPRLSLSRQLIGVEQQAHGHTADIDRPLSVRDWAADTAALLDHLGIGRADVCGFSSGSAVAMQLALDNPQKVRKLILISFSHRLDGLQPELQGSMDSLQPEHLAGSPYALGYEKVAPRPQDWPKLIEKIKAMELASWPDEELARMGKPTLLIVGDADIVRPEGAAQTFRALGGGVAGDLVGLPDSRLAILPGTTHMGIMRRGDWLAPMIEEFLSA